MTECSAQPARFGDHSYRQTFRAPFLYISWTTGTSKTPRRVAPMRSHVLREATFPGSQVMITGSRPWASATWPRRRQERAA